MHVYVYIIYVVRVSTSTLTWKSWFLSEITYNETNFFPHQDYNKTTLNEAMLFEELVYVVLYVLFKLVLSISQALF